MPRNNHQNREAVSRGWSCKADKKGAANALSHEIKLDLMLEFPENPRTSTSTRQAYTTFNGSHTAILNILKENKIHPYKMIPSQDF